MLVLYYIEYENSVKFFFDNFKIEIKKIYIMKIAQQLKKWANKENVKVKFKSLV